MTDKMKNILIGLFVITSVTIAVSMILFLKPKMGDGQTTLRVRFNNIAGIVVGTRVTFAGKPVGEVVHIREIPDARNNCDAVGKIYFYELILKTDSSVTVYDADEIAIRSNGLMGERSVAILPKAQTPSREITQEIIYANATDPLENSFNQITKVTSSLDRAIARIDVWFQENSDAMSSTIKTLHSVLSHSENSLAAIEQQNLIPLLGQSADLLKENLQYVKFSLFDDQLLHKIAFLAEHFDEAARAFTLDGAPMLNNLKQITQDLVDGTGTIGRLINRDDFYLHFSSLLSKAETLMNDINHYGILFQYDKHWQRSRTKKANILKALDSPKEFRSYFEGEIDAITASLGRLSELLERAENVEDKNKIAESEHFKTQFAALLRHAQSLTDSIKLYNEGFLVKTSNE